jgi:integrase
MARSPGKVRGIMSKAGDTIENPVTGERIVVRVGTEDSGGELLAVDAHVRPGGAVTGEHVHPAIEEYSRWCAGGWASVSMGASQSRKAYALGEPKTKKSRRTIGLTKSAVAALQAHLSRQLEEMERVGALYQPGGLIFATETGTIINPSNLRNRSFKPLLKRAGLPPIRFHDLRHTCATLLLSRNVNPKIVSEMLGHASVAITLDTYSHVLPTMQAAATAAMEDALS